MSCSELLVGIPKVKGYLHPYLVDPINLYYLNLLKVT